MFTNRFEMRQIRQGLDATQLQALSKEMASKGHLGLRVARNRLNVPSLDFLADFRHLKGIEVRGIAKGIQTLATLPELETVALCELATRDVSFLKELAHLDELWIHALRLERWESFGDLKRVKAITLFNLRNEDFAFLGEMEGLQVICIDMCSRITALPSLRRLKNLRRVMLDTVNRLVDISGVAEAPNLQDVIVSKANQLAPEAFDCLCGHQSIKGTLPGIGLMNSAKWRVVVQRIPNNLVMQGFYGTENEHFQIV